MELRQLRQLLAVAEELSFTRAARRLNMSQPPLSQSIQALEEELGARLFLRTSRRVEPTEAGRLLAERARRILAEMEEAAREAALAGAGRAGRLRLGFMGPALNMGLAEVLGRFRRERPGVELELVELSTPRQIEELKAGRIAAGFVRLVEPDLPGLEARLFAREEYVLALPPDHDLCREEQVDLARLSGLPLIMYPREGRAFLYDLMTSALMAAGVEIRVAQEVAGKEATLALVSAGLGLAIVPASSARSRRKGVAFRPLSPGLPPVEVWLARREGGLGEPLASFHRAALASRRDAGDAIL